MSLREKEYEFQVEGMDCTCDADLVESAVSSIEGVKKCEVYPTSGKMRVITVLSRPALRARLDELDYDIVDQHDRTGTVSEVQKSLNFFQYMWQQRETRLALLGALLIIPALIYSEILGRQHMAVDIASLGALVVAGIPIMRDAWRSLRNNLKININVLMTIAAGGAVIIGTYTEAGMVMVLFAIGEALEGFVANKARHSIRSLVKVVPNDAIVIRTNGDQLIEERISVNELKVSDVILVKPGARIPMDGRVIAGVSHVNQAPITGESRLIEKANGSQVFASSINGEGLLKIEVTHLASDNTISRLIKMVEEAQDKRAVSQRFIDRFAEKYTPAVVGLAAFVALFPPLFLNQPFFNPDPETFGWFYRGLALLVVACPCALVISTPVSIISAISNAARSGVLIKGGVYLERLSVVKAIAFDKTGTLTKGKPSVVAVRTTDCPPPPIMSHAWGVMPRCDNCDDLVALASAVERYSEHPLAQAIVSESDRRGVRGKYPVAENVTALPGRGVTGRIADHQIIIGSHSYFEGVIPHPDDHCDEATRQADNGYTPIMISEDGKFYGTISVSDVKREESRETIEMLKQAGIETMVMLTGDSEPSAQAVGEQIGMTDVRAELLPEEKVHAVKALQADYGVVAMVGDGINDTPALATADVGIAIGGSSSSTAQVMETADITLMSDDLRHLPFVVRLSRAMMNTIRANVVFSLGIKLLILLLVLLGLGTMWMAVIADVGTALLVTLNGIRLLDRPKNMLGQAQR